MLTHLSVNNFTLVESLELELDQGLTAITGETGAGKSILLGALGLAVGERSDADKVRNQTGKAEVTASFDIAKIKTAQRWLKGAELDSEDSSQECILRRSVSAEGRSRAFINGRPVTLQQLKALGELLVNIHGQHEHQSLLKKERHRALVDDYAKLTSLLDQTKQAYQYWQGLNQSFIELRDNAEEVTARYQLLSYQVTELDDLGLQADELAQLEGEQTQLANAEDTLIKCQQLASLCDGDELGQSLREGLTRALGLLNDIPHKDQNLCSTEELLTNALIQVEEASSEVDQHIRGFNADPERLLQVEQRLSRVFDIARKHRVQPHELFQLHQDVSAELASLLGADGDLEALEQEVQNALAAYHQVADKLSQKRQQAAKQLSKKVNLQLQELAMSNASLLIECQPLNKPSAKGLEELEFLISTNPGQPHRPLAKIASGGELSRVSLAIQVVTAQTSATPTLVFDEVDVGIGGATADVVGRLLRELGSQGQVLCVTHLPQVASKGHQHLQVSKLSHKTGAESTLTQLDPANRVNEIARMLGGEEITAQAIAHAKEMISA